MVKKERQNNCDTKSMQIHGIRIRVVTVDTAKHFIIPTETLFVKGKPFLFIRQHKLRNDVQS